MSAFLIRRFASLLLVLLVVGVFVFLLLRLVPGDPAAVLAGESATAEQVAQIRERMGLDRSLAHQFVLWAGDLLRGNFGESYFFRMPVLQLIMQRLEPTLALGTFALIFAVPAGILLGVIAAFRRGSWLDRGLMAFAALAFSVPVFVLGYLLMYLFAVQLELLPVQGYSRIADGFGDFLQKLILPGITLATVYLALVARITRTSLLEVLGEDYIRTARSKGVSEAVVLLKHALRNASVPVLTVVGIGLGTLVGGAVVTESVFAIPGLGRLTVEAVLSRDFPVIQALILFFSLGYVLINLIIDVGYAFLDPRIRY